MAVTRVTTYCCPPFERAARHASLPLRRRVYVCKPGTHQPWLASWGPGGSCCRVRSASASCNSDSFDHVAEVAGYVCPGSALLASAHRDASSLRGLRVSGAWSESCDVANAHPARAPCPPTFIRPPAPSNFPNSTRSRRDGLRRSRAPAHALTQHLVPCCVSAVAARALARARLPARFLAGCRAQVHLQVCASRVQVRASRARPCWSVLQPGRAVTRDPAPRV